MAFTWDALAGDGVGHNVVAVVGRAAFDVSPAPRMEGLVAVD